MADFGAMFGATKTDTFLGLPPCQDLSEVSGGVALLWAPSATPYEAVGAYCAAAPQAIREVMQIYTANLHNMNFDLGGPILPDGSHAVDCGDLPCDENDPVGACDVIRNAVGQILDQGAVPVVIGGDDSIPIPLFEAFEGRGDFTLVQIDAHIDWRNEVSGEMRGLSSTMRRASEMPHIGRIIQVGQRGLGSAQVADWQDACDYGVEFVSAQAVHQNGITPVLEAIEPGANVLVAFDCDALDPSIMPGVIGRTPGGLDYWQVIGLIQGIAAKARIAAFDLVEFMPERDVDGIGALNAAQVLVNVIGVLARQQIDTSA